MNRNESLAQVWRTGTNLFQWHHRWIFQWCLSPCSGCHQWRNGFCRTLARWTWSRWRWNRRVVTCSRSGRHTEKKQNCCCGIWITGMSGTVGTTKIQNHLNTRLFSFQYSSEGFMLHTHCIWTGPLACLSLFFVMSWIRSVLRSGNFLYPILFSQVVLSSFGQTNQLALC